MKYWSLAPILLRPNRYTNSYLQAYGGVTCGDLEKIRTSRSKNMRVANISPQVRRKCVSYFKLRRNTGVASRPHPARPPHVGSGLQPLSNLEVGHYLLFPIPQSINIFTFPLSFPECPAYEKAPTTTHIKHLKSVTVTTTIQDRIHNNIIVAGRPSYYLLPRWIIYAQHAAIVVIAPPIHYRYRPLPSPVARRPITHRLRHRSARRARAAACLFP